MLLTPSPQDHGPISRRRADLDTREECGAQHARHAKRYCDSIAYRDKPQDLWAASYEDQCRVFAYLDDRVPPSLPPLRARLRRPFRSTGRFAAKTKQLRKTIAVTNKRTNGSTRQSGFPYTSASIDVLLCHGTAARDYAPLRCLLRKSITALKRSITSCVQWQLTGRLSGDCARMYSTLFATKLEAAQRPHGFTRSSHSMAQYLPRLEHDVLSASLNTHRQQHTIGLTSQHSRCQPRRRD